MDRLATYSYRDALLSLQDHWFDDQSRDVAIVITLRAEYQGTEIDSWQWQ
jgi:hypothetical protein